MNALGIQFKQEAHRAILSGYHTSIAYYEARKKVFLQQLGEITTLSEKTFLETLNQQVAQEVDSEINQTFENNFAAIQAEIELFIKNQLEGKKQSNEYEKLLKHFKSLMAQGKSPENVYPLLKKDINSFLFTVYGDRKNFLSQINIQSQNQSIQNQLFGYARKVFMNKYFYNSGLNIKTTNYKNALKGYYKEELLVGALRKVLTQYGASIVPIGDIPQNVGSTAQGNIDLGIMKSVNSIPINIITSQQALVDNDNWLAGLQSKSWVAAFESQGMKNSSGWHQKFGSHSNLMPIEKYRYYWHAGVKNLMNNVTEVVGAENILFSTGTQIYFTSELLTQFRANSYVLAFYKSKNGPIKSPEVSMYKHEC